MLNTSTFGTDDPPIADKVRSYNNRCTCRSGPCPRSPPNDTALCLFGHLQQQFVQSVNKDYRVLQLPTLAQHRLIQQHI